MKKLLRTVVAVLFIAGCSSNKSSLTLEGDIESTIITATSTVSGQIIDMKKGLGEKVKKGDVIAIIEHDAQQYTVQQLQAVVDMKKAVLEEMQGGARPQQIEQAEALVRAKTAKLAELQAGTRPQQIEQAKAQVRAAKAQYDLVASGNREEQIAQAKNSVLIAKEAVDKQQIAYNHVKTNYDNTFNLYNEDLVSKNDVDKVKVELDVAEKQLATLTHQLDTSKQQVALLQKGARSQEKNIALSNYEAAQAQLKLLQSGPTKQTIDSAQAEVDQATAQLKLLESGATRQAIRIATSDVEQAEAQLKQAQSKLDSYSIKALDDGIIISKSFELGDVVSAGSQIVDIALQQLYVVVYVPTEYIHQVSYNQKLSVKTAVGKKIGRVRYIALEDEYMPKDKQTGKENEPIATKVKVALKNDKGALKPAMTATVTLPLK